MFHLLAFMFHLLAFNAPCRRSALRHEIMSLFSLDNAASLSKNTTRPPLITLDEKDIVETFCRGSGPGGQKINKSTNKVRLRHIPTGATVAVQEQRDLTTNRSLARKLLREKVDLIVNGSKSKIGRRISKIQKRKSKTAMRSKKKYDIDGKAEQIPTDGQVEVVETADSYNSDSDSDSDSDDSDSDDDK